MPIYNGNNKVTLPNVSYTYFNNNLVYTKMKIININSDTIVKTSDYSGSPVIVYSKTLTENIPDTSLFKVDLSIRLSNDYHYCTHT